MYDELDQLREQLQSCTEQKWNWAEKHKELKKPELQLQLLMHNGPWYSECIHHISAPEPMEPIW
jgi:hypothetical protein